MKHLCVLALTLSLLACESDVEKAQSRWTALKTWDNQRIEETTYDVQQEGVDIGRAVMRIYRGEENLARFGKQVSTESDNEKVFRVSLMQSLDHPAGMGERVQRLDAWWYDAENLRLRYATQSAFLWNGGVFKEIRVRKNEAYITVRSHISGVQEMEAEFPEDAVPQSGAGFFIRAVLSSMQELQKVPVFSVGSVWLSAAPTVLSSNFRVVGEEVLGIAGENVPTRIVELSNDMGSKRYWIGIDPPSLLVKWEDENGRLLTMTGHRFLDWPQ